MWAQWDSDIPPPLVDAFPSSAPAPAIPPPPGASVLSHGQSPAAPSMQTPHYPWGTPHPRTNQFPGQFPTPQDPWGGWTPQYTAPAYPQSMPSPYIPRQPPIPEMQPQDPWAHLRRANTSSHSTHSTHKKSNSFPKPAPWPSHGGDLSPLFDTSFRMPDPNQYTPHAPPMHTPTSSLSSSNEGASRIPPGMYHERPQQWRHDFKFKSGLASMFRSKSSNARALDECIDSAKLELHPSLRHSPSFPPTTFDLRREALSVSFRDLDRPPLASDMDRPATRPPTMYMRLYHPRLPWYIDIRANGAPYISLGDFFQQLSASLSKQISKHDYYNNDLDDEDREIVKQAFIDRCHSGDEKKQGVKRVDYLRGKVRWEGLIPGKNGMWRLKTGTMKDIDEFFVPR